MTKREELVFMLGRLITFAELNEIRFILTSFDRTLEQQMEMYERGVSKCDGVSNVSRHQVWRAFDIAVLEHDGVVKYKDIPEATLAQYKRLGRYWKSLGGTWGGDWKSPWDIFHFEI